MLKDRTAIVYGAGGELGRAVACGLAAEGARAVLVGHAPAMLLVAAEQIRDSGGRADVAVLDFLDEAAVNDHADSVAESTGTIDISANAIAPQLISASLIDVPIRDFGRSVAAAAMTQLITTRAAARHMVKQRSGVILFLGGADRYDQWARELDVQGVRMVTLLTPELQDVGRVAALASAGRTRTSLGTRIDEPSTRRRPPRDPDRHRPPRNM